MIKFNVQLQNANPVSFSVTREEHDRIMKIIENFKPTDNGRALMFVEKLTGDSLFLRLNAIVSVDVEYS